MWDVRKKGLQACICELFSFALRARRRQVNTTKLTTLCVHSELYQINIFEIALEETFQINRIKHMLKRCNFVECPIIIAILLRNKSWGVAQTCNTFDAIAKTVMHRSCYMPIHVLCKCNSLSHRSVCLFCHCPCGASREDKSSVRLLSALLVIGASFVLGRVHHRNLRNRGQETSGIFILRPFLIAFGVSDAFKPSKHFTTLSGAPTPVIFWGGVWIFLGMPQAPLDIKLLQALLGSSRPSKAVLVFWSVFWRCLVV